MYRPIYYRLDISPNNYLNMKKSYFISRHFILSVFSTVLYNNENEKCKIS